MSLPSFTPPLINSASPWATTVEDLQGLFDSPYTGGVTIRTSLLTGFQHDPTIHQYTFFDANDHTSKPANIEGEKVSRSFGASLNTLGYSPIRLTTYLAMIKRVILDSKLPNHRRGSKPFIISVTGSSEAVRDCYERICALQAEITNPLCMEINLSCPNIPGEPPPAYSESSLIEYLKPLARDTGKAPIGGWSVAVGIKTPPYTYHDQFQGLMDALLATAAPKCPVSFITATNTLGNSLVVADLEGNPALKSASGIGIGGMAGAPLHPLALGNVRTIRSMLDQHEALRGIEIIGVGGVSDRSGFDRMRAVGARVVAVGTALGREGVDVFKKIWDRPSED